MSAPAEDLHERGWGRTGSGDPAADRRYRFARGALERGDAEAASDIARDRKSVV
jgi:hypothetical protein